MERITGVAGEAYISELARAENAKPFIDSKSHDVRASLCIFDESSDWTNPC